MKAPTDASFLRLARLIGLDAIPQETTPTIPGDKRKKFSGEKPIPFTFFLPKSLDDLLAEEAAKIPGKGKSDLIREAVEDMVKIRSIPRVAAGRANNRGIERVKFEILFPPDLMEKVYGAQERSGARIGALIRLALEIKYRGQSIREIRRRVLRGSKKAFL